MSTQKSRHVSEDWAGSLAYSSTSLFPLCPDAPGATQMALITQRVLLFGPDFSVALENVPELPL